MDFSLISFVIGVTGLSNLSQQRAKLHGGMIDYVSFVRFIEVTDSLLMIKES